MRLPISVPRKNRMRRTFAVLLLMLLLLLLLGSVTPARAQEDPEEAEPPSGLTWQSTPASTASTS